MSLFSKKRINLDHAAGEHNPSAIYKEGVEAKRMLEDARTKIARVLHVQARDIIFTSGGTESDNLALLGVFEKSKTEISNPHIVVSSIEHPGVLECAKEVRRRGGEVTIVEAKDGVVSAQDVLNRIKENTVLVSIMYVNNETGAVQPVSKIARLIKEVRKKRDSHFPYLHTDASQAANLLSLDVSSVGVDLMTLVASKSLGPKGTGLLVVRPPVELHPIMFGGAQERGLRPGTQNVPAIVEFAETLEQAQKNREKESERLFILRNYCIEELQKISGIILNSPLDPDKCVPSIISISTPGTIAEFVVIKLDQAGIRASAGSSCKSSKNDIDQDAIRFSFGKSTTKSDLTQTIRALTKIMRA